MTITTTKHRFCSPKISDYSPITASFILLIPLIFTSLATSDPVEQSSVNHSHPPGNTSQDEENTVIAKSCSITLTEFVIYFYLQTLVCFIGAILNLVNVAVFRQTQFIGDAYLYMTAMSLADAITLLAYLPSGLVRCNRYFQYCHHSSFPKFRTIILYYNTYVLYPIGNMSENATVWFTVLLSVERYLAMRTLEVPSRIRRGSPATALTRRVHSDNGVVGSTAGEDQNQVPPDNLLPNLNVTLKNRLSTCTRMLQEYISRANQNLLRLAICRRVSARILITIVAVLSIIFNLPMCFVQTVGYRDIGVKNDSNSNSTMTKLKPSVRLTTFGNSRHYRIFSWFRTFFVYIIPFIFLCVANACLLHFVNSAGNRRHKFLMAGSQKSIPPKAPRSSEPNEDHLPVKTNKSGSRARWRSAQRKLTILLIIVIGLFLAGQIPQAFAYTTVFGSLMELFGIRCLDWQCCSPYQIYRAVTHLLSLLSYTINFFVYILLNQHFKNQVLAWFNFFCRRCYVFKYPSGGLQVPARYHGPSSTNFGTVRPLASQYSSNSPTCHLVQPETRENLGLIRVNRRLVETSQSGGQEIAPFYESRSSIKPPQCIISPSFQSVCHMDKSCLKPRRLKDKSDISYWLKNRVNQIAVGLRHTREKKNRLSQFTCPYCHKDGRNWQNNHVCKGLRPQESTSNAVEQSFDSFGRPYRLNSSFSVSCSEIVADALPPPPFPALSLINHDGDLDTISVDGSLDSRELNFSTSV